MIFISAKNNLMKTTIYAMIALLLPLLLSAQRDIATSQSSAGIKMLSVNSTWTNIKIVNWAGNEVKVEGQVSINNGLNDDAYEYTLEKRGDVLLFESEIPDLDDLPRFVTYEQDGQKIQRLVDKDQGWSSNDLWRENGIAQISIGPIIEVELTFYIPQDLSLQVHQVHGDVQMDNVLNEMDINTKHGHVEAIFSNDIPEHCKISSTHNFVDVSVSNKEKLDLILRTNHGDIYSDLNLNYNRARCSDEMYNSKIVASVNQGGGAELALTSTHGNIYLRGK